ncbi:GNAT family N-acetyltransferase [Mycobacterium sp. 1165178.9]|uniref:GNAT family N-acetyltransferase n=1 Tax=Mycobacterium sp. 1165178.9 TaxID=1834070 RepID=UPI0007FC417E|nr:GNAT family N-acetyltransferase [Mycobacterium sp. 1165178.9]OBK84656.1 hypothetical protein A5652_15520 [Mycobacterium sp. 1165178.9]
MTDRAALVAMHGRCSRATRYSRWLAPSAIFPQRYLRSLLAGGNEHFAVVAVLDSQPGDVVGFASAALVSDDIRELGFLVEDRYQTRGIGTMMLESLIDLCGQHEGLCVSALADNYWLLGKLARFGTVVSGMDHGIIHARVVRNPREHPSNVESVNCCAL